jgi:twitching motility two-component system response regulator PilH
MKKILIVEDDASTSALLKKYLDAKELHADIAGDGLEALEKLKKSTPDLIVLDVIMPRMDGYGFLLEMKKDSKWRSIPVVVVSAREMMRDVFVQEGVKDFVTKPYDPAELYKIVAKYL